MTPIERAARALADVLFVKRVRDCEAPSAPPMVRPIGWQNLSETDRSSAMEAARAVLQAIREPDRDMVAAAYVTSPDQWTNPDPGEAWQAIIDHVLGVTRLVDRIIL